MYDERGSVWRKWDLHVHTPASIIQHYGGDKDEVWEKYISDLENLPKEYSVLGINDYLFIDGYERLVKEKEENDRLKNIDLLLPVVEFRLEKFAGVEFGSLKRINLHVLFSNEIPVETIRSQFLNTLEQSYTLNSGDEWTRAINKDSIADLGKSLKETIPEDKLDEYKGDLIEGFNNLNLDEKSIYDALNRDCFKGKYLTAIGKTEWAVLKWTKASIAAKKDTINRPELIFTSVESREDYEKSKKSLEEQNVNNLLLDCSDAHHFSGSGEKDSIGNSLTWIKADPTFEGLKQILYEPVHRLHIGKKAPPPPPKSIDLLRYNIQEDLFVEKQDDGEREKFCLKGEEEIHFSPNLNCLIGGRGTGKSTLLNLMRMKIEDRTKNLYPDSDIVDKAGKSYSIFDSIKIKGTTSEEVEFLSQNEVERFALDTLEFTKAIYERLKQVGDRNKLKENSIQLNEYLNGLERCIHNQNKKIKLLKDLDQKKKILSDKKKEIEILEDQAYVDLQDEINTYSKELTELKNSRNKLKNLLSELNDLIQRYQSDIGDNRFADAISEILNSMQDYYDQFKREVDEKNEHEEELEENLENTKDKLEQYLSELGYKEENITNISSAQSEANELEVEVSRIEEEIGNLESKINSIELTDEKRKKFEDLLVPRIKELNSILKEISEETEEVEEIGLEYEFDKKRTFQELCDDFNKKELPAFETGVSLSEKDVKSVFARIFTNDFELLENEEILEKLEDIKNERKTNRIIFDFFNDKKGENLKLLRQYHQLYKSSVERYIKIKVTYDGRDIESTSFGQRCTAAIVILLSMGSNPIIIDEPEAHLDSGLIAKYLVRLIKDRKQHRQIIFATHNANFVINGDSELIHILKMDKNNLTDVQPTTIENLKYRDKLVNLEGGKEAFIQRERKYDFV